MRVPLAGVDLHHEVRGGGPTLLLIAGATGDAGHFTRLATLLADDFTVITYDRRGNGRSPAADPDAAAAISAQADDAAAIIQAAGGAALVAGFSSGGLIALELLSRNQHLVRAAVIHEPALLAVVPSAAERMRPVLDLVAWSPDAALEAFFRLNTSDAAWDGLDPETLRRMRDSAGNLFGREVAAVIGYLPDEERLAAIEMPVHLATGEHGLPHAAHVQQWLLARMRATAGAMAGGHAPYLDQPDLFARQLGPVMTRLAAARE